MIRKNVPNILTSCNLLCGCVGITLAFGGDIKSAASMIWLATIFDFLDGFSARILKVNSEIGKQLDSLADMVTFGVLPSCILFMIIEPESSNQYIPFITFIVAVFSAVRLAKFNVDTNQENSFIGLPTPANAILISSLPFITADYQFIQDNVVVIILLLTLILSWMLVAPLEMMALKFKDYSWQNNKLKYTFIGLSVILISVIGIASIPIIIAGYIFISFLATSKVTL